MSAGWLLVSLISAISLPGQFLPLYQSLDGTTALTVLKWALIWFGWGTLTGLLLRVANPSMPLRYVLFLGIGWAIASLARSYLRWPLAAVSVVAVVRRSEPTFRWRHSGLILLGWVALPFLIQITFRPVLSVLPPVFVAALAG